MSSLGRFSLNRTLGCLIFAVAALGAVGLPGCAVGGPQLRMGAQFALGAVAAEDPTTSAPAAGAVVRVRGIASVPTTVRDLLNGQDGKVSGTPIEVRDALTNKLMAKAVTYYDGSFLVDVPCFGARRAAIVSLDLVARAGTGRTALRAPVLLRHGEGETSVTLTPGSTALVAFLADLADAGAAPGEATQLAEMIAGFAPGDRDAFATLAETAPEISHAESVAGFDSGIRQYVSRLRGRTTRNFAAAALSRADGL